MNVIQEIQRINKAELQKGLTNTSASWHAKYSNSAWVYVGGLHTKLTEGDILAVMSQWGEIEDINLVRDEGGTNKSRGFCFVKYEDCRSCVLAVDNFNGSQVLGYTLRVDHVENYRLPKHLREKEEGGSGVDGDNGNERIDDNGALKAGHAYHGKELKNEFSIHQGQDLFAPAQDDTSSKMRDNARPNDFEDPDFERKQAKLQRKAERDRIRREREIRRQEKEEHRRQKRATKLNNEDEAAADDGGDDGFAGNDERGRRKKRHKKDERKRRKQKRSDRSTSTSRSAGRRKRNDSE